MNLLKLTAIIAFAAALTACTGGQDAAAPADAETTAPATEASEAAPADGAAKPADSATGEEAAPAAE